MPSPPHPGFPQFLKHPFSPFTVPLFLPLVLRRTHHIFAANSMPLRYGCMPLISFFLAERSKVREIEDIRGPRTGVFLRTVNKFLHVWNPHFMGRKMWVLLYRNMRTRIKPSLVRFRISLCEIFVI